MAGPEYLGSQKECGVPVQVRYSSFFFTNGQAYIEAEGFDLFENFQGLLIGAPDSDDPVVCIADIKESSVVGVIAIHGWSFGSLHDEFVR